MKVVDLSRISLECGYVLQELVSISIETELNHHGLCHIQGVVNEDYYKDNSEHLNDFGNFKVIYQKEHQTEILFAGYFQNVEFFIEAGLYKISFTGISQSKRLDVKKLSQSYQNSSISFEQLFEQIIVPDGRVILSKNNIPQVGRPFIQYQCTKWEFIQEVAGLLMLPVIPVCTSDNADIIVGVQKQSVQNFCGLLKIKTIMNMSGMRHNENCRGIESDYICCEVEAYDYFKLGEHVFLNDIEWIIARTKFSSNHGFIVHKYLLVQERSIGYLCTGEPKNKNFSLTGTILHVEGNTIKVHLDIDDEQPVETAYPYQYYPVSGNVMYSMPEIGTRIILTMTDHFSGYGIITDCIPDKIWGRRYTQRTFETEEEKKVLLGDSKVLWGSNHRKQYVSLTDAKGIEVFAWKSACLKADEKIMLRAEGGISIMTEAWMSIKHSNTINEIVFSGNEIIHTAAQHTYSSGKQSPKKSEKKADIADFPSMELTNVLFGMIAQEPAGAAAKALIGGQPVAGSPNVKNWKKSGSGFGSG